MGVVTIGSFEFQDGDCGKVDEDITANIEPMSMPGSGPSDTLLFDFEGVLNSITLKGALTDATTTRVGGQTIKTIEEQKIYLKALVNGAQSSITLTSTFNVSGISVMIQSIHFGEEAGDPNELPFDIKLNEGSG